MITVGAVIIVLGALFIDIPLVWIPVVLTGLLFCLGGIVAKMYAYFAYRSLPRS